MLNPLRQLMKVSNWVNERMQLQSSIGPIMSHRVPLRARWFYVFGSATLTCFLMQILTGIMLAMVYVPSAGEAYQSLEHLNYVQPLGWYIRTLHNFFGNAMVFMLICHLLQVVIFAAYKYPRELTWVFGVVLFICVLARTSNPNSNFCHLGHESRYSAGLPWIAFFRACCIYGY